MTSRKIFLFLIQAALSMSFSSTMLRRTARRVFRPLTISAFAGTTQRPLASDVQRIYTRLFANPTDGTLQLDDDVDSALAHLTPGSTPGFYIVKQYKTSETGFDIDQIKLLVTEDFERLELTPYNISVPVALMILDPDEFPSRSRARKACRKANIMIHRGPLHTDSKTEEELFDPSKCERARVGDRVFPGDVIAKQVRMGPGSFPILNHKKPPFDLPTVFEDDYFGIVNKPEGVVVYAHKSGGHGTNTVRAALPFAVQPPKIGTYSTLRRPQPVHRLDKPTSGLLLIAKTKPAMVHLSHQFRDRKVKKTYVAIVNGIPSEPPESSISSREAYDMGVDIDPSSAAQWQLIDEPLDEKSAVTIWRPLNSAKSLKANGNSCTMVELKPKTGRYHQLRRHMALVKNCALVGDSIYDGGGSAIQLREDGLFLCSNRVILEHPFYNSKEGREVFDKLDENLKKGLEVSQEGTVLVKASIPTPEKFELFMKREETLYSKQWQDVDPTAT